MKNILLLIACIGIVCSGGTVWAEGGTVKGHLLLSNGKPLDNGQVFFFAVKSQLEKPVTGKYWRVPDEIEHVDDNGKFTIQLETGSYYIGAIKRFAADKLGPPQVGDYFLPVHDSHGRYRVIVVKSNSTINIGKITGIQQYSETLAVFKGSPTVIEGRIISASAQPVKNMYVLAYTDPSMQGRPSFVSGASDVEGRYHLRVDKGRTFYLKVRGAYAGGRPQTGDLLGVFGSLDDPAPVEAKTSTTTSGIDIQVEAFAGRGQ